MKNLSVFLFLAIPTFCHAQAVPVLSHSHVNGTVVVSTTVYSMMGQSVVTEFTTEAWAQVPWYKAGTFSNMYVQLGDNSITNDSTFTIRINGASGTESVRMSGSTVLVGTDSVHTDHVNSGDKVDIQIKSGSGGTDLTPYAIYFLFTPDDPTANYQRWSPASPNTGSINTNGNQPYYSNVTGLLGENFYESNTYHVMRTSGTFANIGIYVISNARTENIPFSLKKNGVNTGVSVMVNAGATGLIEDTTTQVNFVIGDTVTIELGMNNNLGNDTNAINKSFITMDVINTGTPTSIEYAAGTDGKPQNAGESWTVPFEGALTYGGNTYSVPALVGGTFSNFCVYESNNTISTVSTVKFLKNFVTDPNVVMTIPVNSSSGTWCDNGHSVTVVSTDTVAYITNSPSGTGSLSYGSIMAAFSPTVQTTPVVPPKTQMRGNVTIRGGSTFK